MGDAGKPARRHPDQLPELVAQLTFTTVKDYDDWIARLHQIPKAFDQVTTNMSIGIDDHRVPPSS